MAHFIGFRRPPEWRCRPPRGCFTSAFDPTRAMSWNRAMRPLLSRSRRAGVSVTEGKPRKIQQAAQAAFPSGEAINLAGAASRRGRKSASKPDTLYAGDALFFRDYTFPWLYLTRPESRRKHENSFSNHPRPTPGFRFSDTPWRRKPSVAGNRSLARRGRSIRQPAPKDGARRTARGGRQGVYLPHRTGVDQLRFPPAGQRRGDQPGTGRLVPSRPRRSTPSMETWYDWGGIRRLPQGVPTAHGDW